MSPFTYYTVQWFSRETRHESFLTRCHTFLAKPVSFLARRYWITCCIKPRFEWIKQQIVEWVLRFQLNFKELRFDVPGASRRSCQSCAVKLSLYRRKRDTLLVLREAWCVSQTRWKQNGHLFIGNQEIHVETWRLFSAEIKNFLSLLFFKRRRVRWRENIFFLYRLLMLPSLLSLTVQAMWLFFQMLAPFLRMKSPMWLVLPWDFPPQR